MARDVSERFLRSEPPELPFRPMMVALVSHNMVASDCNIYILIGYTHNYSHIPQRSGAWLESHLG